jgi:hypothetical protein
LAFCFSGAVLAMDANDIALMVKNGVPEAVIINMLQSQGLSRQPSSQEIMQLNANGVSPQILEYITRAGTAPSVAAAPIVTVPPPVLVTQPQTVYCPSPSYVYPQTYYYQPYYGRRRHSGLSFGFSFGGGRHHRRGSGGHHWRR